MFKTMKKYLLITLGSLSVALGVIGIFLPILPTTPFLLLAVFCYLRSSKKLYRWLVKHKVFGTYIYNYITYKAVLRTTKIFGLIFLWTGLITSMILIDNWHIKALLFIVGIGVSIHIFTLKTIEKTELRKYEEIDEIKETL